HDEMVDRTTNGRGRVADLSRFDLLTLDAGSWMHTRFAGTRIPTLEEALLAIGPHALPVSELKTAIAREVLLKALRRYDLEEDVLVISFHPEWLVPLRTMSRDLPIGLLADTWSPELPERASNLAAVSGGYLILNVDALGTPQVQAAESRG